VATTGAGKSISDGKYDRHHEETMSNEVKNGSKDGPGDGRRYESRNGSRDGTKGGHRDTSPSALAIEPASRKRSHLLAALGAAGLACAIAAAVVLLRSRDAEGVGARSGAGAAPAAAASGAAAAGTAEAAGRGPVMLPQAAGSANPIHTVKAELAPLAGDVQLIGNVGYDADHFAIVGPLVSGRVARLAVGVGSRVRKGQIMAELESAEVGAARAALLSAKARLAAADANLRRERELAEKRISSSREREMAEAQWATEKAEMRAAHERLRAIGLTSEDIRAIEEKEMGGRVPMRAPIDGTVIERLVTLGEAVERATDAFKLADLTRVWVLLDVYEKDLSRVRVSQTVEVRTDAYPGEVFHGKVAYVVPVIDQATRTAKVRVEIDNSPGKLRLGQLVTAKIIGKSEAVATPVLTLPRSAIQRIDGKPLVFVKGQKGFERRGVELGVSGGDLVEIRQGIVLGDEIAADGAFLLKSELLR
jgi:membrane fusion protein, heavy metal efflux system